MIPFFPWIVPGWRAWGCNPRKGRDQILPSGNLEEEEAGTLLYDRNLERGLVAKIHRAEEDEEFYLTVDTHNSGTSCTLKVGFGHWELLREMTALWQ